MVEYQRRVVAVVLVLVLVLAELLALAQALGCRPQNLVTFWAGSRKSRP